MINSAKQKRDGRIRRHNRLRRKIRGSGDRPRLAVFRSNRNIYAQIIDDVNFKTLVSCSTLDPEIKVELKTGKTCEASKIIGQKLAERSLEQNIKTIIFDRGPYLYHGRIKALAEGAREGGLEF